MAPSRVARCVAAILAAVLCIGLVSRHYHGPSSSPSLLLEKPQGSLDEKAEPGIPRTWISDKDLAASPLLYSSSSSASLPGQGILSTAMHSPGMSLASAPPSAAVAAAAQPGQGGKGEQDPSKVQDLKDEGLKQAKVGAWGRLPSKKEFHKMVAKAEQDAALLSREHPRSVMGAHWRLAVSHLSDRHSELAADKTAAEGARLKQEQRLHDLEVEHEKHVGIYAPKASLKAMGLNQDRAPRRSAATEAGGKKSRGGVEDAPERYPAVSYFSRLRELSRRVADVARPSTSRPRHLARGMLYQRNVGLGANNARQEEYVGDVSPLDWKNKESEGERVGSEPSRVEGAQKRLAAKWRRLMANPPPVTAETRPDIVDRTEHRVSDYDEFLRKKREMKLFGAAIDGFESDPEFNPLTVMLAHSLTKYGIPPPESDDIGVWQSWYTEVLDRYHMLEEQVAALAQGRGSGNIDHGEDDHRRDRFQHVQRRAFPLESDGDTRTIRQDFSAMEADKSGRQRVMTLRVDDAPRHRLDSPAHVSMGREQRAREGAEQGELRHERGEMGKRAPYSGNEVDCGTSDGCYKGVSQSRVETRRTEGREIRKIQDSLELISELLETRRGGAHAPRIESSKDMEHDPHYSKVSTLNWFRGATNSR